jgi:hypothetical protein
MSYVTHRQGVYRTGFRPYSNPFAAAQLDGVGLGIRLHQSLGRTPFDPEMLHGYPFTPGGGSRLGDLGDIVPNGAVLHYQATWVTDIHTTPDEMLASVTAALSRDGLHVMSATQSGGFLGELWTGHFQVDIVLQVSNGMGFGNPNDAASIVDHEAYLTTGQVPASQISVVSIPGAAGGVPDPGATDWNTWIQQNALWIGAAVVGVALLPSLARRLL